MISFNIETNILVAVWSAPIIFQGYFRLVDKDKNQEQFIFYRCENSQDGQIELLEEEFTPHAYQFTHLYREPRDVLHILSEDGLYLLAYALYITIKQMLTRKAQYLTYMDEVALSSMTKRVHMSLQQQIPLEQDEELGFAVAMDIDATQACVEEAIDSLFKNSLC